MNWIPKKARRLGNIKHDYDENSTLRHRINDSYVVTRILVGVNIEPTAAAMRTALNRSA